LAGETEVLGENLPQRHFVHHKSHLTKPVHESGPPRWEDGTLDSHRCETIKCNMNVYDLVGYDISGLHHNKDYRLDYANVIANRFLKNISAVLRKKQREISVCLVNLYEI
jgi:hypothetical protein